jgi:amino acid transporter
MISLEYIYIYIYLFIIYIYIYILYVNLKKKKKQKKKEKRTLGQKPGRFILTSLFLSFLCIGQVGPTWYFSLSTLSSPYGLLASRANAVMPVVRSPHDCSRLCHRAQSCLLAVALSLTHVRSVSSISRPFLLAINAAAINGRKRKLQCVQSAAAT